MNALAYRPDIKITDLLGRPGKFTLSAEVIPPRNGAEQSKVLDQVAALVEAGAEFLSVTKGAGGSLRGGSLPIAQLIKERLQVPCIAHFTCRDLTAAEVENHLMDHHYFGIRNILALRGDPPDGQPDWKPREGGHSFAYELLEQIRNLNQGRYLSRTGYQADAEVRESTDFCLGAAAYPEHPDPEERIRFFELKARAGAEYGITDMCFDITAWSRFRDECAARGITIPLLPGTRLLRTREQAERVMKKFRVSVPAAILNQLPSKEDAERDPEGAENRSVELLLELTASFKAVGAPGLHLFVISDTSGASKALRELRR
jgi:methylenetetrahydrofolate reductase (NADPH)